MNYLGAIVQGISFLAVTILASVSGTSAQSAPSAALAVSTPSPAAGSRVVFADTSGGSPTTWSWDFGDGGHSAVQNPAHTYGAEGTYTVRLTASNASGTSSATSVVTVTSSGVLRLNAAHSFDVTLTAHDQRTGADGSGVVIGQNDVYGYFSLPSLSGNAGNPEVIVKMVDASGIGQNYWVFYGTMTDLEYTISVKENATGIVKQYSKNSTASGQFDTSGFPTPTPSGGASVTPTPTPGGSTTPVEIDIDVSRYVVGSNTGGFIPGTSDPIQVTAGVQTTLVFSSGDVTHGFSGIPALGIAGTSTISAGDPSDPYGGGTTPVSYHVTFTAPDSARGQTFAFKCTQDRCGPGHDSMTGLLHVN
jgi:PKD repeat protein